LLTRGCAPPEIGCCVLVVLLITKFLHRVFNVTRWASSSLDLIYNVVNSFPDTKMTSSNLVTNQPLEEVNNNNDEGLKFDLKAKVLDDGEEDATVYSLSDTVRLTVSSPEEWLCVSRMPLDFTQSEFQELMQEYGPMDQYFLIHSETSGMHTQIMFIM